MRSRAHGEFEAELMTVLRASPTPLTARQIADRVAGSPPTLPPVFSALNRLAAKGELVRSSEPGRGLRFAAVRDEAAHVSRTMIDALRDTDDRGAALLQFAGELSPADRELLTQAIERGPRTRKSRR